MSHKILFVIPAYNNPIEVNNTLSILKNMEYNDSLIIDDGSTIDLFRSIQDSEYIKYIKHDENLGFGAVFISAIKYAKDFSFEYVLFLNPLFEETNKEIPQIIENIEYGFDIITISRVLENYTIVDIQNDKTEIVSMISQNLKEVTSFDLTDPLSEMLAIKIGSLENMEFSEFDHGLFIQLWIQAAFFGLNCLELPAQSEIKTYFDELDNYEDPLGYFLTLIEAEKFLYHKGEIN